MVSLFPELLSRSEAPGPDPRVALGQHFSPEVYFQRHLRERLLPHLETHLFADLFGGQGALLLPLLEALPLEERNAWAKEHLYLADLDEKALEQARARLVALGVSPETARQVAERRDTLRSYPAERLAGRAVYHVTNPPYLYLGRVRKTPGLRHLLPLFQNSAHTDLYALALENDLRHPWVQRAAYLLPANFLFGEEAGSIRRAVLDVFWLEGAVVVDRPSFESTDVHVGVFFLVRKERPRAEPQEVPVRVEDPGGVWQGTLRLRPEEDYRPGGAFRQFLWEARAEEPVGYRLYLPMAEVLARRGPVPLRVADASRHARGGGYAVAQVQVEEALASALLRSPLYLRTLDTGKADKRAGIRPVAELGAEAVVHSGKPYRTHPIALLLDLDQEGSLLVAETFNALLEYFRSLERSAFLTGYKGSKGAEYPRKYLGLGLAEGLLRTLPKEVFASPRARERVRSLLRENRVEALMDLLRSFARKGILL